MSKTACGKLVCKYVIKQNIYEMSLVSRSPSKSKKTKSFKFPTKSKEKREKSRDKEKVLDDATKQKELSEKEKKKEKEREKEREKEKKEKEKREKLREKDKVSFVHNNRRFSILHCVFFIYMRFFFKLEESSCHVIPIKFEHNAYFISDYFFDYLCR